MFDMEECITVEHQASENHHEGLALQGTPLYFLLF